MGITGLGSTAASLEVGPDLGGLAGVLRTAGEVLAAAPSQSVLDRVRDEQVLAGWPQTEEDLVRGTALLRESRVARESPARVRADHERLVTVPGRAVPVLVLSRGLEVVAAACLAAGRPAGLPPAPARAAADPWLSRWLTQVAQRSTTFFYQGVAAVGLGALRRLTPGG